MFQRHKCGWMVLNTTDDPVEVLGRELRMLVGRGADEPGSLSQLRDIHAAPPVPWWPPAPGWWLLAVLVLILLTWLGRRVLARIRVHQRRKQMLGWIDHLNTTIDPRRDPQAWLSTLNRIFKLVALRAFPGQHCAALAGSDWADISDRQNGKCAIG